LSTRRKGHLIEDKGVNTSNVSIKWLARIAVIASMLVGLGATRSTADKNANVR